ncbi:MAG: cytochrome c oxidase subunit [Actinomycetota bacterium]|nr:cytochrome c oxidase subunit [Actinomycetota bacterium]
MTAATRRRALVLGATVVVVVVLPACGRGSPSILDHHGPEARHVAGVWWLMFGLAAVVYVVVAGLVVIAIVRGRGDHPGPPAGESAAEPTVAAASGPSESAFIWAGGIVAPVAILALLAVVTVNTTKDLRRPERGELTVEVTAKRWWWDVRYPESGVATASEIHIPVGRPIHVVLRSDNVVHSFWVPQLAGKLDAVPGQTNHLRFQASEAGTYLGECAEYCGIQHARMGFEVIADTPADFDRWLARRSSAGTGPTTEQAAEGQRVFMREACAGCHTIRNTEAVGRIGPDLSDFGSRRWIGSVTVPNNTGNLAGWISDSQTIKPGNLMPPISLEPDELSAIVAYLESLK